MTRLIVLAASMPILAFAFCGLASCQTGLNSVSYEKWTVSEPIMTKGPEGSFDNVATKDPSIVFYNGKYHLFYTAKSSHRIEGKRRFGISVGYTSSPTLEGLKDSKRYDFKKIVDEVIIAPQIFFFEPQKKWYLIAHKNMAHNRDLAPVYLTNENIEDVNGWSKPKLLRTGKAGNEFWIDFWVICDDQDAHLFYSNQRGSVLRMQCPIDEFPQGLTKAEEKVALTVSGDDDRGGPWRMFEAVHIYHVKKTDQYLAILECGYENLNREKLVDARNRFLIAMVADKLQGPWRRVESGVNEYFADASALYNEDGTPSAYTLVSHPELIRNGYNQKLEITDFNITMLMQSFDGSAFSDNYYYSELPWELAIVTNY